MKTYTVHYWLNKEMWYTYIEANSIAEARIKLLEKHPKAKFIEIR